MASLSVVCGVAFGAYVLPIAFGPYLATLGAIEIPADFFLVNLVSCALLFGGLGCSS